MYSCKCRFEGKYLTFLTTVTVLLMFWIQQAIVTTKTKQQNKLKVPSVETNNDGNKQ